MTTSTSILVSDSSQIGEARRASLRMAQQIGLDETTKSNLSILATELATNLSKFGQRGEIILRRLGIDGNEGIEILSVDRGPGIRDVAKCQVDGFSTAGTTGNGLGSIKRLSTVFDIYSSDKGTVIVAQIWKKPADMTSFPLDIGAVSLPYPGETLCGDAWSFISSGSWVTVMVADGLGHGPQAAEASNQAVALLTDAKILPQMLLQKAHGSLRSTRGAAAMVLQIKLDERKIICSGIGNISAGTIYAEGTKSFVSLNGTVGHQASRFQEFEYPWASGNLIVIYSDGLQTKWKLADYPGLQVRHPSLIAAVLFRDFRRERDDFTVLILRQNPNYPAP